MISRIIIDKGIYEYMSAIRHLRAEGIQAVFQLLGPVDEEHSRGIMKTEVMAWVEEGLIDYLGTTEDVRPYIEQADCIVLPSYREGTPRTLLEAASSAKPIVCTRVPGCQDVVEDGFNGLLCEPENSMDLALKMKTMLTSSSDTLRTYGMNGRIKVENEFQEKLVLDKYLYSIEELSERNH
jgi:glycosyltransferase involved in cell wall biosynthesis